MHMWATRQFGCHIRIQWCKKYKNRSNFKRGRFFSPTSVVRIMHVMNHTKCTDVADVSTCFPLNSKTNRDVSGMGYTQRSCEKLVQIYIIGKFWKWICDNICTYLEDLKQKANSIMRKVVYSPPAHRVPSFLSTAKGSQKRTSSENDFHPRVNG
jgi:hypothetical protein